MQKYYTIVNTIDNTIAGKILCTSTKWEDRSPLDAKKIVCKKVFGFLPEEEVLPYLVTTL